MCRYRFGPQPQDFFGQVGHRAYPREGITCFTPALAWCRSTASALPLIQKQQRAYRQLWVVLLLALLLLPRSAWFLCAPLQRALDFVLDNPTLQDFSE